MEVPNEAVRYCVQNDDIAQLRDELVEDSQKVEEYLNQHYQKALATDKTVKKINKEDPYLEAKKALSAEYKFVTSQAPTNNSNRQMQLRRAYLMELLFVLEQFAGGYIKDHEDETEIENLEAYFQMYGKRVEGLLMWSIVTFPYMLSGYEWLSALEERLSGLLVVSVPSGYADVVGRTVKTTLDNAVGG